MYQHLEEKKGSQKSLTRQISGDFHKTKHDYAIKLLKGSDKSHQSSARYLNGIMVGVCHNSSSAGNSAGLADRKKAAKQSVANNKLKANLQGIFGSTGVAQYQKKQFRLGKSLEGLGTSGHSHSHTLNAARNKDNSLTRGTSAYHQEANSRLPPKPSQSGTTLPPARKPKPPLAPSTSGYMTQGAGGFKVQVSVEILPGAPGGGYTSQQVHPVTGLVNPAQAHMVSQQAMPALPRPPITRGNLVRELPATDKQHSKSTEQNFSSILAQALEDSIAVIEKPIEKASVRQIKVTREEKPSNLEMKQTAKHLEITPSEALLIQHENFEISHRETIIRQQEKYLQMSEKTEDLENISMKNVQRISLETRPSVKASIRHTSVSGPVDSRRGVGDSNPTPDITKTEDSAACLSSNAKNQINWLLSDQVTKSLFEKIYRKKAAQEKHRLQ
jgi:hypothetical protein